MTQLSKTPDQTISVVPNHLYWFLNYFSLIFFLLYIPCEELMRRPMRGSGDMEKTRDGWNEEWDEDRWPRWRQGEGERRIETGGKLGGHLIRDADSVGGCWDVGVEPPPTVIAVLPADSVSPSECRSFFYPFDVYGDWTPEGRHIKSLYFFLSRVNHEGW